VREFLYCHGQAGTMIKFAAVSLYPAKCALPGAAQIGQSQAEFPHMACAGCLVRSVSRVAERVSDSRDWAGEHGQCHDDGLQRLRQAQRSCCAAVEKHALADKGDLSPLANGTCRAGDRLATDNWVGDRPSATCPTLTRPHRRNIPAGHRSVPIGNELSTAPMIAV
jgi:hypothetical protein